MNVIVETEQNGGKGRFYIELNGKSAAFMTFVYADRSSISIEHTEVNPDFKGKGLGKLLVAKAVEYARENGLKITPLCPFVKSVFDKTPGYKDVLFIR